MDPEIVLSYFVIISLIVTGPGIWYFINSVQQREKRELRQQYMELIREKLDVIKTALAMGRSDEEIKELDARLERLIGTKKMLETLKNPKEDDLAKAELNSKELDTELELLRQGRERQTEE